MKTPEHHLWTLLVGGSKEPDDEILYLIKKPYQEIDLTPEYDEDIHYLLNNRPMSTEPILELIRENLITLKKFWETEIEVKKIMADIRIS